ncbi:Eco57I restriction-modification methylase domain-containing protein [Candidatus Viridilinea mediisalina]|uniref:site-specific DNA-methyltransferase (adenine-specific) n=1 Tax=Candidatus Viridilinea mediisalina TaxID=2024553 RepID=A0A2A6RGK3_9CHLR|nr:Eco57I restriction-modification methylase domain-containing protein [Candidatus Viridilinea mediisalina]PDW02016.1 hypothetical protein CJ255_16230 [Candidatus Viridilinea mediisalina]
MNPAQLPLALSQRHYNRQLFADHYLDETLRRRDAWFDLLAEATPVLAQIRAIFANFTPSSNEAQTERELVRPVLEALGHTFEVQAALRTPKGTKKPDYVFYRDEAARQANKGKTLNDAELTAALAIGEAKFWDRKLDVSLAGVDEDLARVPSDQIAFYMRHAGVTWGILTNGRRWRLYHKDTVEKQDRYYEVDLKQLSDADEPEPFLYFYAFFRRAAFEPALGATLTLEGMLRESVDYAHSLSASLKNQAFDALRHLAQGFLDYPRNQLQPTPTMLHEIYGSSLIVLYRLLFIFYAEARELLPLRENANYRNEYSLYAVVRGATRRLDSGMTLLVDTGRTWAELRDLFGIINAGSPPLNVATFNGGLFDPEQYPFLERYTIGDAQLQLALDQLARIINPQTGSKEFIDYRDLAERHLGTIYEGLLEYHLVPLERSADGFSTDVVNDKGERHRTGSYYTPDFAVQYIVEQTLRPLLDAAVADQPSDEAKIAAILNLNCLDPAMGSGHFPVAATEYIARYLVELAVVPPAEADDEPDLAYWKRRVAQSCIYGVDLNPLAVDLAKLSLWLATAAKGRPLSFLDHHMRCGNALVGARAAQLDTATTPKKPTRRSKKEPQSPTADQLTLLDDAAFAGAMASAVNSMWLIEGSAARSVADVKEQERIYETVRAGLTERFGALADLVTAAGFGVTPERSMWQALAEYVTKRDEGAFATPAFERPLKELRQLKAAQRFFHWDLEFPEVFYDRYGRWLGAEGGFDLVMGNPPYVRQEQLGLLKPYFEAVYPETYSGTADLFVYFFQQGIKLLRAGGRLGYIASNAWLRANYATPLRNFLRTNVTLDQIIDLGDNRIFHDAPDVYPAIPLLRKLAPPAEHSTQVARFSRSEGLKEFAERVAAKLIAVSIHDQPDSGWQLIDDASRHLLAKLLDAGKPLEEVVEGRMYRGVLTGLNNAFIINQATRDRLVQEDAQSATVLKPLVNGADIRSWLVHEKGRWLILLPDQWTAQQAGAELDEAAAWEYLQSTLPAIARHIAPFAEAGRRRADQGGYWWELRPCNYYAAFDGPKIFWPEIANRPRYSVAGPGIVGNKTTFMIPGEHPYLLGLLMSRTLWFAVTNLAAPFGERKGMLRYLMSAQYIARLPIPEAAAQTQQTIGDLALRISAEAQARYKLHERVRRRILSDLGGQGNALNQKLSAWWHLDFPSFREELRNHFRREIALKERDDWEEWLNEQRQRHEQHTTAISAQEHELNHQIYQLFALSAEEIRLIEEATTYQDGAISDCRL